LWIGSETSSRLREKNYARTATGGLDKDERLPVSLPLEGLWPALPSAARQHLLKALSQIVIKQIQAPPSEKEAADENP
jgi:hypothetical protein